jgi:hypothetical protein
MREFKKHVELLGYYIDKYNETKKDEFVIATFLKIKAVLNYGDNMLYRRTEESVKLFMESKDAMIKGIELIKPKVGGVYKYGNELLDICIDAMCNIKHIEDDTNSVISIKTSIKGIINITNALASVLLEPLDELKMLQNDVYETEPSTEILRYLANLTYAGLNDENARTYPDRVVNKLKEFTYRYTASIIEDVKDNKAIKKVLLKKHGVPRGEESSIFDLMVNKGECMDKDYNVTKRVKDDNLNEFREILAGYIEYNNKIEEVSEKYMSIMKNFPDALSGEFYLDASGCNYNELLDLWPSPVTFVNIEALEKMKDILDKSIAVHNVYSDLLKGFDK